MAKTSKTPGIDQRVSGKYRARISFQGVQYNLGDFETKADAKAARDIALGEKARGTFVPPAQRKAERLAQEAAERVRTEAEAYRVRDLAEEWFAWQERRGLKQGTIYTRRRHYEVYIRPEFGDQPAGEVTPEAVTAWHDRIDAEKGNGVSRGTYMTLAAMYNYGAGTAKGLPGSFEVKVLESPCKVHGANKHRAVRVAKRDVATPAEVGSIAARMPESEQLAVLLGAWCGVRIGEVLALRRRHIVKTVHRPATQHWLYVDVQVQARGSGLREESTKSEAGVRTVPIPKALVPVVEDHLKTYAGMGEDGLLFPRTPRGKQWTHPNSLRAHFNAARDSHNEDQAGQGSPTLDGFTFHKLRHTALTRVGQAGATLEELKRFGGHSDAKTVQRYQHADLDRLAAHADTMDSDIVLPTGGAEVVELRTHASS
ncbi:tyrosine-type recombinase/integrase [Zhihengliuella halotolerans]|uniref:tyrosine-type recombinase/integrase n=1 Tax=Zhihengliuella halotolerans TaxID=370736 RepID=UPI0011AF250C|nr:tyrosine-type recombinase/integrase [Zhihengliuella halotolerans]